MSQAAARFEDKVVLITGAASGIGAATARRFAAEGALLMLGDIAAVFAHQHEAKTEHGLTLAAVGDGTAAHLMAIDDIAEITHIDGYAVLGSHNDIADLFERRHGSDALNEQLFARSRDVAAADVGVVAAKRTEQVQERQAVLR